MVYIKERSFKKHTQKTKLFKTSPQIYSVHLIPAIAIALFICL